jgi:hypothetical protein
MTASLFKKNIREFISTIISFLQYTINIQT